MARTNDEKRKDEVRSAINSLREVHPSPGYGGCRDIRTREIVAIEKKIADRMKQLELDSKLVKLKDDLAAARKAVHGQLKRTSEQINDLRRRLDLRGVSEELLRDIEKLAATAPVVLLDRNCE